MKKRVLALCLCLAGTICISAGVSSAQVCAGGYSRDDRDLVMRQSEQPYLYFTRMQELAGMSANGVFSITQRLALENEFIALKQALSEFGDRRRRRASAQTNRFLGDVIDSAYLGLTPLTITGPSIAQAQENARNAIDGLNQAEAAFVACLWGSWDRHQIVGTPNDGNCGGGFDRRDRAQVRRRVHQAMDILANMSGEAQQGANSVFALSQFTLIDFDLDYYREDLDILGNQFVPGVSNRTRRFLRTVLDPIYLGIDSQHIAGGSIAESQQLSRDLLAALNDATSTLYVCGN